jgi:hypothetical protein
MDPESVVYAVSLSPEAKRRLRAAANLHGDPDDQGKTPEHELHNMTRQLTGQSFDDLVQPSEIVSRRPYLCVICGQPFSLAEFNETRRAAKAPREAHPFLDGIQTHARCSQ